MIKTGLGLKKKIKSWMINSYDRLLVYRRTKHEIKKIKDSRRVALYSSVELTASQKEEIDKLYIENFGKKIPYVWHRHVMSFTGKFDKRVFPELLYIPMFEHYMNDQEEYNKVYGDKNVLPILAKSVGIKMPKTILAASNGLYLTPNYEAISKEEGIRSIQNSGKVFCKPSVGSMSGRGCLIAEFENGVDIRTGKKVEEILDVLGENFVIQECIKCHSLIADIYADAVNTFRIITYRWKDQYYHTPVVLRMGTGGGYMDNAHSGGCFVAIDDDGTLHNTAYTEFRNTYTKHPDSGVVFEGYKIDLLPSVIDAVERMHAIMPQVGIINWDVTIDETGEPLVIEANTCFGGAWIVQLAHGCGLFGENTEEILRWLGRVRKMKKTERGLYRFGRDN